MPWSISDDEFTLFRGEITIRHINGNALLALGTQLLDQRLAVALQPVVDRRLDPRRLGRLGDQRVQLALATGAIIGGLLGAIGGGIAGYEIAGAGDRVLGTVLGVGGGSLIGGLIGSLFDGDRKKNLYDCEAALDSYLTAYGAPAPRLASREIAYPYPAAPAYGYSYPQAYSYGYTYAPPQQVVLVPVRTEVQQQVVVRETTREETYTVPGASRIITEPRPSGKLIRERGKVTRQR